MRWTLRLFGFPVFELSAEELEDSHWGNATSGQFELVQADPGAEYVEPDEGFGFRGAQCLG